MVEDGRFQYIEAMEGINVKKLHGVKLIMNIRLYRILTILILFIMAASPVTAQEYRIGPEDLLQIEFWQDNSLDAEVRVRLDGKISLDIIGEVQAAGLSTAFLPVDPSGVTPEDVEKFSVLLDQMPKPILAYCRSGARCTVLFNRAQSLVK